jgi:AcrR family transcriptional regulator
MKVEGRSIAQIGAELGVATRTLHVWFSDDLIKAEVRRLLQRVDDLFVERLAQAGMRALDEMVEFASTPATSAYYVCRTCGYGSQTPGNHGDPQAWCAGPWEQYERISENTKLRALDSIMDRVDQTTKLRDRVDAGADSSTVNNYLQVIQNMPDEELAGMLRAWGAETNGASGHQALPESS